MGQGLVFSRKRTEFTVEKPDRRYLSQVTKVNMNSHKSC